MAHDGHNHEQGCDCGADGDEMFSDDLMKITMADAETGEEYEFTIVDDFEYKGSTYCVLVTLDDEDPELVITKEVVGDDGEEGLMSLDEDEADEIYAEYDRLCEDAELLDEDDETESKV